MQLGHIQLFSFKTNINCRLLNNFVDEIVCLQQAVRELAEKVDADYAQTCTFVVGFEGSFGDRHVSPRTLKARFLGNLACCEGIVTKCKT